MADQDTDLDAAERALGLRPIGSESERDRAAREAWEMRLAALADGIAPVTPPPDLLARIERQIDQEEAAAQQAAIARVTRGRSRWRAAAIASTALAASLAVALVTTLFSGGDAVRYVAVVYSDADPTAAGMVVQIDPVAGTAVVIPVIPRAPAGASYEMWQLREGAERPVSIGLLPAEPRLSPRIEAAPGDLFAISLEPEGGSPTGAPTEALYHGRVVSVPAD
ncbi:MAG: anti-sigma factor domain-containing protein [Paracoccaceae bacterium]